MGESRGGADAPGKPANPGGEANGPARGRAAFAAAELRRLIPEGGQGAINAALATLAELGDPAALREVEAHLAGAPLRVDYGDRDDDPLPWELGQEAFGLLARWWRRLGLAAEHGAWLAADWLGDLPPDGRRFGPNGFELFTRAARHIAEHVAPPLVAASAARKAERRARPAPGSLDDSVVRSGLVEIDLASLPLYVN